MVLGIDVRDREDKKSMIELNRQFDNLSDWIESQREIVQKRFEKLIEDHQSTHVDKELLNDFLKEPYAMIPKKGHEWYVIVPKFINMQVGYLDHATNSFNIFIVNKYVKWLSEIPEVLEAKLKFPEPLPFKVYDGMLLTGPKYQEKGFSKYRKFLSRREGKDRLRIKKGYEFKLIAQLIEDGTLPFTPRPISPDDLREWSGKGLEKYEEICQKNKIVDLQEKAWKRFLEYGAMGLFWSFGAGKSLFGHRLIGNIKGSTLVVVPTLTLKEQWEERLDELNPKTKHEVTIETYHAYHKVRDKEWRLTIFDECQHLPANTFIRLSTLKTKYRIGMSGSPFREDGRENYIFALTGIPMGLAWEDLLKLEVVHAPKFRLFILKDKRQKDRKLEELMRLPLKTIIFCDSLDYGEQLSKRFEIPFVYSATRDRLDIIRESDACVVSRVGDMGISLRDIERVIEVAFLFGSRMQESQRFGRLMHSTKENTQHIILMTEKEFELYQKRLKAILERGFKIEYIR